MPLLERSCGAWVSGPMAERQINEQQEKVIVRRRPFGRIALFIAVGLLVLLLVAIAGIWIQRRPIATHYLKGEFERRGVTASYHLDRVGLRTQEVSNLAKTLYDRLRVFTNHFDDIGRNLDRALDAYNKGVRSLETRVLVTARRFKERGAIAGDEIETLEPIDKATRPLSFDDGGLFPEEEMPLLKARSAKGGKR